MSSPDESTEELKGGHPPALKVGNMRVPTKRHDSGSEKISGDELAKQAEEFGSEKPEKPNSVLVSGALAKEDKAYSAESVKSFHDKPKPSYEKSHAPAPNMIQQPRKQ